LLPIGLDETRDARAINYDLALLSELRAIVTNGEDHAAQQKEMQQRLAQHRPCGAAPFRELRTVSCGGGRCLCNAHGRSPISI
jgi:hypothetical protein